LSDEQRFFGSHRETAQLLGISEEALRRAVNNRACPVHERGGDGKQSSYFWPDVVAWRIQDVMPNDLSVERARLAKEQADRAEMQNAERRGQLVDVDDVRREWSGMVLAFRAKMLALGRKLATRLKNVSDPAAIESRITTEVNAALEELADDGEAD
jgi:phage terminase Nu1 subunit (DNA packaging protein)